MVLCLDDGLLPLGVFALDEDAMSEDDTRVRKGDVVKLKGGIVEGYRRNWQGIWKLRRLGRIKRKKKGTGNTEGNMERDR